MTDLEDLRKRYASRPDACPCGESYRHADTRTCAKCQRVHAADPSVLALCDEVEALRAQVAQSAAARGVSEAEYLEAVHQLGAAIRERDEARAQVAAAPVVLREWPKTVGDAPGEWFFCLHGDRAPRGRFEQESSDAMPVFRDDADGDIWPSREFEPGEFFVRVP